MKRLMGLLIVAIIMVAGFCIAAPEPSILSKPGEWTADVQFEPIQQITLPVPGSSSPQRFWYVILTITNNTGQDVGFYPKCELMTNTLEIIPSEKGVPGYVFDRIKIRHQGQYSFLESLKQTSRQLLQGENHTKDIAVIWPDFDAKSKGISLFITGLSNETAVIYPPGLLDENGDKKAVFLRKTLKIDYKLSGDAAFRSNAKIDLSGKSWVMR